MSWSSPQRDLVHGRDDQEQPERGSARDHRHEGGGRGESKGGGRREGGSGHGGITGGEGDAGGDGGGNGGQRLTEPPKVVATYLAFALRPFSSRVISRWCRA
mgnify:CR=1 FL=1